MSDEFSVIDPTQAVKIIAYQKNADGTLSPTPLAHASVHPIISPADVMPVLFYSENTDGTLSSTII